MILSHIAALLALVALAGCVSDDERQLADVDYRARYPIGVTSEVVEVVFPGGSPSLQAADAALLDQFVATYLDRGQKPIVILLGGSGAAKREFAVALQEAAIDHGLARSEVIVGVDPVQPEEIVTASFVSYTAVVPECGYWLEDSAQNFENANSLNFGCATQHNLGMMLADPSDLVAPSPFDPRDGPRTAMVIDLYRRGLATGAEYNEFDVYISDVGE